LLVIQVAKAPKDISRTTKVHQSTILDKRLFVSQDLEMKDLSDIDHVTTFLTSSRRALLKKVYFYFLGVKLMLLILQLTYSLQRKDKNKGAAADPEL
jgi:hypothetical protein